MNVFISAAFDIYVCVLMHISLPWHVRQLQDMHVGVVSYRILTRHRLLRGRGACSPVCGGLLLLRNCCSAEGSRAN